MKKRIFTLILCAVMLLAGLPAYGAATIAGGKFGVDGDNLTWTLDRDGTITIEGEGEMENFYYITQTPWGKYQSNIKNVVICEGVTSVGNSAFYQCDNVRSITIAKSVKFIDAWAFYCAQDKPVVADVYYEGTKYELFCGIDADHDFNRTLFEGILHLKDGSHEIVYEGGCGPNVSWRFDADCILTISGKGPMDDIGREGSPWEKIHPTAYSLRTYIDRIVIEPGVTYIGKYAFDNTPADSVFIPDTVEAIGERAFNRCYGLTSVYIPDSVTDIGEFAFTSCNNLSKVHLSSNITELKMCVFTDTALESVTIPNGVKSIGTQAFSECNLASLVIPDGVESIGLFSFDNCRKLESVYIPVSVNYIDLQAFSRCDAIKDIYYGGSAEDWANLEKKSFVDPGELFSGEIHYNISQPKLSVKIKSLYLNQAGNIIVTVETDNLPSTALLAAAAYSADGRMTAAGIVSDGKCILPAENAETVKVFCWNGTRGLKPIFPVQTAEVQE